METVKMKEAAAEEEAEEEEEDGTRPQQETPAEEVESKDESNDVDTVEQEEAPPAPPWPVEHFVESEVSVDLLPAPASALASAVTSAKATRSSLVALSSASNRLLKDGAVHSWRGEGSDPEPLMQIQPALGSSSLRIRVQQEQAGGAAGGAGSEEQCFTPSAEGVVDFCSLEDGTCVVLRCCIAPLLRRHRPAASCVSKRRSKSLFPQPPKSPLFYRTAGTPSTSRATWRGCPKGRGGRFASGARAW